VASDIFFDEKHITDELVDQWYYEVTDRDYVRFVLRISRATRHRRIKEELDELNLPTLLVWGRNDKVTPPEVADQFRSLIRGSQLRLIDKCGHAPNLEQPEVFSGMLQEFLPRCFSECQQRDIVSDRLPIEMEQ
jgi:pimeloyl-ACP methyl ester carboxylesterase